MRRMSQSAYPLPEPRREPTNEELAHQEWAAQQQAGPEVAYGPQPGQALAPYHPAVPPRPEAYSQRWVGPSGYVPAPVFRYRQGRDSPGCMVGLAISSALMGAFFLVGNLSWGSHPITWAMLGFFAITTLSLIVGAAAAVKRNRELDQGR